MSTLDKLIKEFSNPRAFECKFLENYNKTDLERRAREK